MRREKGTLRYQAFNCWVHENLGADHLGDCIRFVWSYYRINTRIQPQTSYCRGEGGWEAISYPFHIGLGPSTAAKAASPAGAIA
eukprot:15365284-Ditylum_brightwellii.AAC.1